MKVLIADDNRLMLEGFRRALERVDDIEIAGATSSGAQLMDLVERRRPNVVAMELGLRTADGTSCLEAIRAARPEVKVVVLSASPTAEMIRSALGRGASAFVVKNIRAARSTSPRSTASRSPATRARAPSRTPSCDGS